MNNFNTIYQELYKEYHEKLEQLKTQALRKKITIFTILFVACILAFYKKTFFLCFAFFIPLVVTIFFPFSKKYRKTYKETIIKKLVTAYDQNLSFIPNGTISSNYYDQAEFERYDNFFSNDVIFGKIDNQIDFKASDVRTEIEQTDKNGNRTTTTVFAGIFSYAKFNKDINNTIKIRSDKGFLGKLLPPSKQLIQLDSQEFEKLFDVYSTDKILAMRVLTSDILNYMIDFKRENKINYEITLKNSSLYIRIHCKDMFEAPFIKDSLDFDTLHLYYKIINFICELNKKFYYIIKEKNL